METLPPVSFDEFEQLVDSGRVSGRAQLIEGRICRPVNASPAHNYITHQLAKRLRKRHGSDLVYEEKSIRIGESLPQPDIAVLTAAPSPLAHSQAADIAYLVEVSSTTLSADLGAKARLYRNQIKSYVVIDVLGGRVVVPNGFAAPPAADMIDIEAVLNETLDAESR